MKFENLFSKGKIGNLELKNRVVMPAMMVGFGQIDGNPTEKETLYFEERAKGGVGLIITGITRVYDSNGTTSLGQLSISHDRNIEPLKKMLKRIQQHGTKVFIQLHHPGMQNVPLTINSTGMAIGMTKISKKRFPKMLFKHMIPFMQKLQDKGIYFRPVAPSKTEPCSFTGAKNRALSVREIKKIEKAFVDGAIRAKKAGADGVEIHASHGYLIQEFLSPRTNQRTDEYGGSLENRMRFLMNVYHGIREACGKDYPISVRLTVDEFYEKIGKKGVGYTLEEGLKIAQALDKVGVDVLNISSANYETMNYWLEPTAFDEGWRSYLAGEVKKVVKCPVIAASFIRSPELAEKLISENNQDFVALGRPQIADPNWCNKAKAGDVENIKRCIGCLYCFESMLAGAYEGASASCSVNPFMGFEQESKDILARKNGLRRKVLIVGAGPAGLTAATMLAIRDFDVTVVEKNDHPGGQVYLASVPPKKDKLGWMYKDAMYQAEKAGVKFIFNKEVDEKYIKEINPFAVVFATGGVSRVIKAIKGHDKKNCCVVTDILDGTVDIQNKKVILVGSGMTGLEASTALIEKGNKIIVVEMLDKIAKTAYQGFRDYLIPKLKAAGTEFYTSYKLLEVLDDGILAENQITQETKKFTADFVILSLGVASQNKLYKTMVDKRERVYAIGDAHKVGRIAHATRSAYDFVKGFE